MCVKTHFGFIGKFQFLSSSLADWSFFAFVKESNCVIVILRHALGYVAHAVNRLNLMLLFFSICFALKVSNWKKVLERLVDYYEVHLEQRLSGFTMPDVTKIGKRKKNTYLKRLGKISRQ